MNADLRAALERHHSDQGALHAGGPRCDLDGAPWPCDATRARAELEAGEAMETQAVKAAVARADSLAAQLESAQAREARMRKALHRIAEDGCDGEGLFDVADNCLTLESPMPCPSCIALRALQQAQHSPDDDTCMCESCRSCAAEENAE